MHRPFHHTIRHTTDQSITPGVAGSIPALLRVEQVLNQSITGRTRLCFHHFLRRLCFRYVQDAEIRSRVGLHELKAASAEDTNAENLGPGGNDKGAGTGGAGTGETTTIIGKVAENLRSGGRYCTPVQPNDCTIAGTEDAMEDEWAHLFTVEHVKDREHVDGFFVSFLAKIRNREMARRQQVAEAK